MADESGTHVAVSDAASVICESDYPMRFLERFWFGCGHCHDGRGCPVADQIDPDTGELRGALRGGKLVAVVIMVFLVPLAMAVLGAYLSEAWWANGSRLAPATWQLLGAVGGFFAGVGLAKLVLWVGRAHLPADGGVQ